MLSTHVYLISAFLLLVSAFLIFRIVVRRDYQRRGRLTLFSSFLELLIFFMLGIFSWIDIPAVWPSPYISPILRILAWIFIAVGLSVMFVVIAWFGLRRSFGQEVNVLKQSGPYRLSRNPQTVACALAVIGFVMLWPTWHSLGWVILYVVFAHMMVLTEEEHLRSVHGKEYEQYCERVPRYLGFPRRSL